ncbi:MAG: N-acetylmuramoyl-L-alanine amidase [Blautia sp.]|nr:N-acetylmuramoyl-L-alanine amidase [Blautia sp.]
MNNKRKTEWKKKLLAGLTAFLLLTVNLGLPSRAAAAEASAPSTSAQTLTAETDRYSLVIDAGHGGEDGGASFTHDGYYYEESHITLKIALYAREYLKKNAPDIDVHMIRTKDVAVDIEKRIPLSLQWNPDLYFSIHINTADALAANGASVLISYGTWRPYIKAKELLLGQYVLEELTGLGLSMRFAAQNGMEYRLSEDGSKYPNGAIADYFNIIRGGVMNDFPAVIVEHAFLSNYHDAVNYLRTDAQLKRLGEADAIAIMRYFSQQEPKVRKDGWVTEDGKKRYYEDNILISNQLYWIGNQLYYFDTSGNMATGFKTLKGKTYYFAEDGHAVSGIVTMPNQDRYCFNSRTKVMYTNYVRKTTNGNLYFFGSSGKMLKNRLVEYQGRTYCLDQYGLFRKNKLQKIKGYYYYFGSDGAMKKGWLKRNGKWYYFHSQTGIQYRNRTLAGKYRFDAQGVCLNKNSRGQYIPLAE